MSEDKRNYAQTFHSVRQSDKIEAAPQFSIQQLEAANQHLRERIEALEAVASAAVVVLQAYPNGGEPLMDAILHMRDVVALAIKETQSA